jgi:hypothetical protein
VDRFRIKIWHKATGAIVYDNQLGAADDDAPTTALGGGSIVIHKQGQPLTAAGGAAAGTAAPALTEAALRPIVGEAIRRWAAAGLDAGRLAALRRVDVQIADLTDAYLGFAFADEHAIRIDSDAAGHGWFADPTPWEDSEFRLPGDQGEQGRADLLSTVAHELGHLLGLADLPGAGHADDLMGEALAAGSRRVPTADEVAEVTGVAANDAGTPPTGTAMPAATPTGGGRVSPEPASIVLTLVSDAPVWLAPAADEAEPTWSGAGQPGPSGRVGPPAGPSPEAWRPGAARPEGPEALAVWGEAVTEAWWAIDLEEVG